LLYNHKNPSGGIFIAEIDEIELIARVKEARNEKPNASILVILHWNFDLEILPFPIHREFSRHLIDAGANLVAGHHAHCVQGGEMYKNGYIIYGLGNFFIPNNVFADQKLTFPEWTRTELVLEWKSDNNIAICHWFQYQHLNDQHELIHIETNNFETCPRLKALSPYREMNDLVYLKYFKSHRRKKRLIPVYVSYKNTFRNKLNTQFLKIRARFARHLAKRNIIKWQH
jgi:poly-gamma-glutamate synthesis protein (capsule biosynthesis protein)